MLKARTYEKLRGFFGVDNEILVASGRGFEGVSLTGPGAELEDEAEEDIVIFLVIINPAKARRWVFSLRFLKTREGIVDSCRGLEL